MSTDILTSLLEESAWATNEIQGAKAMRAKGLPFSFLPLFGFADPEAVLAADKTWPLRSQQQTTITPSSSHA
jgi:hypothetical protein